MKYRYIIYTICVTGILCSITAWAQHSISEDELDPNQIFYGDSSNFSTPAEVDMDEVIKATPEYKEIIKKKINRGTGRYWILQSNATARAHKAITEFAKTSEYDLIANTGYLSSLETPIEADDVTKAVIKNL